MVMDTKVRLRIQGLTSSHTPNGPYALILSEESGLLRRIIVIVGMAEAQSIAIALERIIPPRPLTHDLFVTFLKTFGITLKEVFIHKFEDGIFYSELVLLDGEREVRLDSRTSDAIAIALRAKCGIYTTAEIVRECSVVFEQEPEPAGGSGGNGKKDYRQLPAEPKILDKEEIKQLLPIWKDRELEKKMEGAILEENYELAKIYQDELYKRRGGEGAS
jgi:bifunctional DNase/RNase